MWQDSRFLSVASLVTVIAFVASCSLYIQTHYGDLTAFGDSQSADTQQVAGVGQTSPWTASSSRRRLLQDDIPSIPQSAELPFLDPFPTDPLLFPNTPDLTGHEPTGEYAAVCLVVKDQQADIREWLLYHIWLGIKKFYLYDHESSPPMLSNVLDLVQQGYVEYTHFTGRHKHNGTLADQFMETAQAYAYNDCLARHRGHHQWIGFFDPDEFLIVTDKHADKIDDILRDYEGYGGLAINWILFSSSGHKTRPKAPVMLSYTKCYKPAHRVNKLVKLFVNPRFTLGLYDDPHRASYSSPHYFTVTEMFQKLELPETQVASHTRISINHYMSKSAEDWRRKMQRGAGDGKHESDATFHHMNVLAVHDCTKGVDVGQRWLQEAHPDLKWRAKRTKAPLEWPPMTLYPNPAISIPQRPTPAQSTASGPSQTGQQPSVAAPTDMVTQHAAASGDVSAATLAALASSGAQVLSKLEAKAGSAGGAGTGGSFVTGANPMGTGGAGAGGTAQGTGAAGAAGAAVGAAVVDVSGGARSTGQH